MFDHKKDALKVFKGTTSHLEQRDENGDVQLYSNAEYDHISEKWVPEPQLISDKDQYMMTALNVEKELKKAIPLLEKLMPIARAIEQFSTEAIEKYNDLDHRKHVVQGQFNQMKMKLDEYENERKSIDLKKQIADLENKPRKAGRPKKETRTIEVE